MRRIILALSLVLSSQARADFPDAGQFGLGMTIGSLIAVNGKYFLDKRGAISFGIGGMSSNWTIAYGEYLYHIPGVFGKTTRFGRETSLYAGGGGGVGAWRDTYTCGRWGCDRTDRDSGTGVFVRGLFGFEWYPQPTQFGVFAELGPSFIIAPGMGNTLDIEIGGRFYF